MLDMLQRRNLIFSTDKKRERFQQEALHRLGVGEKQWKGLFSFLAQERRS